MQGAQSVGIYLWEFNLLGFCPREFSLAGVRACVTSWQEIWLEMLAEANSVLLAAAVSLSSSRLLFSPFLPLENLLRYEGLRELRR